MAKTENEIYQDCMHRFIDLANTMKDEGVAPRVVSAGLMSASAVYGTYVFAGNDGRLAPTGIQRMVEAYQQQVEQVQRAKAEHKGKGSKPVSGDTTA